MSSTTKKPPIDAKSKEDSDNLLTTVETYLEYDNYVRLTREENERKKRNFSKVVEDVGEELINEITEKNNAIEEKRIELIENIYKISKETVIPLKDLKDMEYEEVLSLQKKIIETKKPWWRQVINMFR